MMSEDLSSRTVSRRGLLAATFAAGGMLATLAGCSSGDPADAAAASDGSSKGTLKVAMELAYSPFETRDEQGGAYRHLRHLQEGLRRGLRI